MAGASDYTEDNIIKSLLRGVAFPLPAGTYISLHTSDPGDTGTNEVSTGTWASYVRRHAENGASIGTGWGAPSGGSSTNLKQVTFPSNNASGIVTVTHFAIWDAITTGNCLASAALNTPRALNVGDILVFDVGSLTVTVT